MILKDLMQQGNITISVSLNDLKEFAQDLIKTTKQELEQQITDANTETYPSPEQVAKILDVDRTTLWRWHRKGYLCHTEIGGKRRYRMSDINALLNGGKRK
jgi:transcriptional regulator of acetoin/glycerol metabolism